MTPFEQGVEMCGATFERRAEWCVVKRDGHTICVGGVLLDDLGVDATRTSEWLNERFRRKGPPVAPSRGAPYDLNEACRIARIKPAFFNAEASRRGFYRCAPPARTGQFRQFTEHDLVTLFIWARSLENGWSKRGAGELAGKVRAALRDRPRAREVTIKSEFSFTIFDVAAIRQLIRTEGTK